MKVRELLALIPSGWLDELAEQTQVNHQVKKLDGQLMFKLCLMSMLNSHKHSLRVMEAMMHSPQLAALHKGEVPRCRFTSISDRLATIRMQYFEALFGKLFGVFNAQLGEHKALACIDSTYVTLGAKVFAEGMRCETGRRAAKHNVCLVGSLPFKMSTCLAQACKSDDLAMGGLIAQTPELAGKTSVFDRGISSRQCFDAFSEQGKYFVSRLNPKLSATDIEPRKVPAARKDERLRILRDCTAYLHGKNDRTKRRYRIISAQREDGKKFVFVTNLMGQSARKIAAIYRRRWDIEVFFKFLKQHLNFGHLVWRNQNGMQVMLYMTMITAILVLAYKKLNAVPLAKYAKMQFEMALDSLLIEQIVMWCGGDPSKASHILCHL